MTKPRVLIFSVAYLPFVGGAEVAIKELTDRLKDQFDFELITVNLDGRQLAEEVVGGVRVHRLGHSPAARYLFFWTAYRYALKLAQEKQVDVVWAMMASHNALAASLFKNKFPTVPLVLSLQEGDEIYGWRYQLKLLPVRLLGVFRKANKIQAISRYLATWAERMGARVPAVVIPNGVDLEKFKIQNAEGQSKDLNTKILITTSRLVSKNAVDDLIKSLNFLPAHIHLKIVGSGPDEAALRQLVSMRGLSERVEFMGYLPHEEVVKELRQADIFVRASRSEGLGNSFLEAMALGLPVVGTAVGGIPDFLIHGEIGWLCKVNNPESIAEQVSAILNPVNLPEVQTITAQAKKLVEERYTWDTIAQQFKKLLE